MNLSIQDELQTILRKQLKTDTLHTVFLEELAREKLIIKTKT